MMMKQKENRQRANVVHWAVTKRMTANGAYTQESTLIDYYEKELAELNKKLSEL